MKRTWMLYLVSLLSLGIATRSQAQTTGGTEKAVAALEQQWLQSQKTNNPDLVAPLLADKFVSTGSDGKVESKAELLARAKATIFNRTNFASVNNVVGVIAPPFNLSGTEAASPSQPLGFTSAFAKREVQLGVRFNF